MIRDTVQQIRHQLVTQARESVRLVPAVSRKPKVLRHWLLGATKPQLIIVLLLVLVPLAIIPVVDLLLTEVFAPVTAEKLFGLIKTEQENPHLHRALNISHWAIWVIIVLVSIYLYIRHLPVSIEQAQDIAKEKEVEADQLIAVNPSQSVLLYDAARDWCIDEQTESALDAKLEKLNNKLSPLDDGTVVRENIADSSATLIAPEPTEQPEKALVAERYQIINELGCGAMGTVYLAQDIRLNRQVALKQLSPLLSADQQQLARFRQEAIVLAQLSHPNIVQVYDFIEWNQLFLIAIELVEGGDLEDKLKSESPLEMNEIIRLCIQMCEALTYAHERRVIHRDLKPANILLTKNAAVKISDFGIAKFAQSSILTQVNTVMGSPAYMSPEQASGESTDERTDIYSLGIMLYQMICGERPFNGDTKSIIAQHISKTPPGLCEKRDDVSLDLNDLVQKMLAKKPADRFQSVAEISELLKQMV